MLGLPQPVSRSYIVSTVDDKSLKYLTCATILRPFLPSLYNTPYIHIGPKDKHWRLQHMWAAVS